MKRLSILAVGALGVLLGACNMAGGGIGINGIVPEDLGTVTLSITGLPTSEAAKVKVTGPRGYTVDVPYSKSASGLPMGTYSASAEAVTSAGVVYTPTVTGSPAKLERNGQSVEIKVKYLPPPTGQLELNLAGLPDGVSGDVHVTGPGGFDRIVSNGNGKVSMSDLSIGEYQVSAADVVRPGTTYTASVQGAPATVSNGRTSTVNISYTGAANVGNLSVLLSGLPEGAEPDVSVSGPNSFSDTLTGGGVLSNLKPGSYTVSYPTIVFNGFTYAASSASEIVTVTAGATAEAGKKYAATTGKVEVYVIAPISPVDGSTVAIPANHITLNGPDAFSSTLNASKIFENVKVGEYSIDPPHMYKDNWAYRAPSVSTDAVAGMNVALTVEYTPKAISTTVSMDFTAPELEVWGMNTFEASEPWGISGWASDENGVTVSIYDNVTKLGDATFGEGEEASEWHFDLSDLELEEGWHWFTVVATDGSGNESRSYEEICVGDFYCGR